MATRAWSSRCALGLSPWACALFTFDVVAGRSVPSLARWGTAYAPCVRLLTCTFTCEGRVPRATRMLDYWLTAYYYLGLHKV